MARINVEDAILRDQRFINLAIKFGDMDKALGTLVRAWVLAQKWYLKAEDRRVPLDEWRKQGLSEALFEVGLASSNGESVRVAGADEQFGWLLDKREAGRAGGLKSAQTRRDKYGSAQPPAATSPKQTFEEPEAQLRDSRSRTKHPEASFLFSPFSSLSSPVSDLKTHISEENIRAPAGHAPPDLIAVWNANCGGLPICKSMGKSRMAKWRARWNEHPNLDYWVGIVQRIAASSFCQGSGSRGWRADVDFLLKPETHIRVIEGKYDNRGSSPLNAELAQMVREGKV